ncbi:von Willebrand factor A domain-containing protein 1 isoform X1 [Mixophyes fleayi]|uniref:von Willebrand factor A domain-containing protein 1 isoform X1 n=1 Tax=Mixophyes fleayi TaxID=3061075 RepID=UPI003F4D9D17
MLVFLGLFLQTLLLPAAGQTIPKADHSNFVPDSEGDLLFLLDSSGSITYDEFAKVKEFIGDLLGPFKFGPRDVQASVVQISTNPTLEFPLNQYSSSRDVQKAIQNVRQRLGDTNTGKALEYVKENLNGEKFGSRADVPKVLVWMTDGLSTDDISQPMQLLKDMGVTVFIVSTTGRGNFQVLSAAASQPDEKYLKFVDKDDLGIITKELRDSIIELIQAKRLQALDITRTSFRLTWPRLLSRDTGHYILEYAPTSDPRRKLQHTMFGDETSLVLRGLTPNTTYRVTLFPESNIDYVHPQTINVSTLQDLKEERNLEAFDITTTGFRLAWSSLSGDTGNYVVKYSPMSAPRRELQKTLSGDETTVVLNGLTPNTTYQVTLISDSNDPYVQPETIQVSTLPDLIQARQLQVQHIMATSFNLTWLKLTGDTGRYFLDYASVSDPRRKLRKTLYGDQTGVISGLTPSTTYQVTFIPESNLPSIQSQTIQVSILPDLIQTRSLQVQNITATSFNLTWLKLTGDTGRYFLDYASVSDPRRKLRKTLYGDQTGLISGLTPNTTYQVTFIPESNLPSVQSQTIQVSTVPDLIQARNLQVLNITTRSFHLTWSPLSGDTGRYTLKYVFASTPMIISQMLLYGETSAVIGNLIPNTTYQITFIPESNVPHIQSETIQVSTLPDLIQARNLQVLNITKKSFHLAWSPLLGDTGLYTLKYVFASKPGAISQMSLYDETSAVIENLIPNSTYQITFIPESNVPHIQSQTIQVSTLPDLIQARNLQVLNITAGSFHLTWSPLSGDTGRYILKYVFASKPGAISQRVFYDETSAVVGDLTPNTTYQITFIPESNVPHIQSQTIQVSTLPDLIQARNLQVLNITTRSFHLTWSPLLGDTGRYTLKYVFAYKPGAVSQTSLYDETSAVIRDLTPDSIYQITFIPESNVPYMQTQTIRVSTLPEPVQRRYLKALDITSTSFLLTWSKFPTDEGLYVLEYVPISLPRTQPRTLFGDKNNVVITGLSSNTTYEVTLFPQQDTQDVEPEVIHVSTQPELDHRRNLRIRDTTATSFQLIWSRLPGDKGHYVLEYSLVSHPNRKHRKILPADQTNVVLNYLNPNTQYQATLFSESNVQNVPPQTVQISTLQEQLWPAQILISDPSAHSFRVSWGPSLDSIAGYEIQYGPLPSNAVQTVQVDGRVNTTVLEGLKSNTTYLVTVSAIFKSGGEKALSAIACTEMKDSKVKYLRFEDLGPDSLKATWGSADGEVKGYRVRCRRQAGRSSVVSVAPQTHSIHLTDVPDGTTSKICVMPVYKNGAGESLCRKVQKQPGTLANHYSRVRTQ